MRYIDKAFSIFISSRPLWIRAVGTAALFGFIAYLLRVLKTLWLICLPRSFRVTLQVKTRNEAAVLTLEQFNIRSSRP